MLDQTGSRASFSFSQKGTIGSLHIYCPQNSTDGESWFRVTFSLVHSHFRRNETRTFFIGRPPLFPLLDWLFTKSSDMTSFFHQYSMFVFVTSFPLALGCTCRQACAFNKCGILSSLSPSNGSCGYSSPAAGRGDLSNESEDEQSRVYRTDRLQKGISSPLVEKVG